jgi:hypothetical protein
VGPRAGLDVVTREKSCTHPGIEPRQSSPQPVTTLTELSRLSVSIIYSVRDKEYEAVGGMRIGRGNRSTRRKPTPVPLCSQQIPHDLT